MCAIIDTNVRHEVFGDNQSEAGAHFLDWLEKGKGKLAIGGRLRHELSQSEKFQELLNLLLLGGNAINIPDQEVDTAAQELQNQMICKSDDEHVLALARVSGARLLYTNDQDLQKDFKNRQIIGGIQGRVYTTLRKSSVTRTHKDLLGRGDLCGK